jgi:anti-sigma factor RsiW
VTAQGLTCQQMVELVTAYLEGSMSRDERDRFEQHLSACDGCTNYLHQMRETMRLTGMLREEEIPQGQRDALLVAFRDWTSERE